MQWFSDVDWANVLLPDTPLLEIVVRGTIIYLAVFILLRVVLKREAGSMGITDLIVIVFLADAAQNGMAGDYRSVPDGVVLMAVIVFWAFAFDWLSYHSTTMARLVKPPPLTLIKDGVLQWRNMRREFITEEELRSQLRLQGIEDPAKVRRAFMEPDGHISVLPYKD